MVNETFDQFRLAEVAFVACASVLTEGMRMNLQNTRFDATRWPKAVTRGAPVGQEMGLEVNGRNDIGLAAFQPKLGVHNELS